MPKSISQPPFEDSNDFGQLFRPVDYSVSLETSETISPRKIKIDGKRRMLARTRKEAAHQILDRVPEPGEFFHIVSNGKFDYWSLAPILLEMLGASMATMYASTWTLNRQNALEMLQLIDNGKVGRFSLLTGTYFKRRESAVFATIANGLLARGQRIRALENHAKVLLINDNNGNFLTMEGSANFTANPRIEQNLIGNSQELYEHHQAWIEEAFKL